MKTEIAHNRKIIVESGARKSPVVADVGVAVVGGGPAGIAASIAAARQGATVTVVERYPYFGGMATGGLVLLFIEYDRYAYGILEETVQKLAQYHCGVEMSATKPLKGEKTWVEGQGFVPAAMPAFNPETLKFVSNKMIVEAGVKPLLNCLFVEAITQNNTVKGVIMENKEGRQAVLARVTVDATGDGDVFARAGASYMEDVHPWGLSLSYRMANVNVQEALKFQRENPKEYAALLEKHVDKSYRLVWFPTTHETVALFFQWLPGLSATKVEHLVKAEIEGRAKVIAAVDFFRKNIPGFENSFLFDTSPQIGTRESRRVIGEYVLTKKDVLEGKRFHDVVARNPYFDIPYRCLLPKTVDGLLVAGRCISTTHEAQAAVRMICPCYATGEAAGAAAALSVEANVQPRNLNVTQLQQRLLPKNL